MKHEYVKSIALVISLLALLVPAANAAELRLEFPPDWIIQCRGGEANAVGRMQPKRCSLMKYSFKPVVTVDAQGVKVIGGFQDEACSSLHDGIGVDSKSIERLPVKQQVDAMRAGSVFARETSGLWPKCWAKIEETSLKGFGAAYLQLRSSWKGFDR